MKQEKKYDRQRIVAIEILNNLLGKKGRSASRTVPEIHLPLLFGTQMSVCIWNSRARER